MNSITLGFVGAGNMARSLIMGLIQEEFSPKHIWASAQNWDKLHQLKQELGIHVTDDNTTLIKNTNVLILAVKPQILPPLCAMIAPHIQQHKPLVISIAAGTSLAKLSHWMGQHLPIVRTMPNAPALVRAGVTALYANEWVTEDQRNCAQNIMRAVGKTLWVDTEKQLDAVTALSGSGPAYFLAMMIALKEAGVACGLTEKQASLLTLQTMSGTASLAHHTQEDWKILQDRIVSKGGTTEAALDVFKQQHFEAICEGAVKAAFQRAQDLNK